MTDRASLEEGYMPYEAACRLFGAIMQRWRIDSRRSLDERIALAEFMEMPLSAINDLLRDTQFVDARKQR